VDLRERVDPHRASTPPACAIAVAPARSGSALGHPREVGSRSVRRVKAFALAFQEQEHRAQGALLQKSKSIATEVAPTSEGGRCAGAAGFCLCSWLPLPRFAGERAGERGRSSLPCAAVSRGRSGREAGAGRDAGSFSLGQDARSKSPAPTHELAGHKPGKRQAGWPSLWPLSLTPGILPSALRASFAVRTRSRRVRGHPRESGSRSVGGRKFLLRTHHQEQEHRAQGALLQKAKASRLKSLPQARAGGVWEQLAFALALGSLSPALRGRGLGRGALFTPLCGGESGTIRPRSGHRQGCRCLFVRTGVRSKSPAPTHELAGHKPGKRQAGWPSLWLLSLTPGILPSALRASFAVRTRSRRVRGHPRESGSRSVGVRKFLLRTHHQEQEHRAQGALLQKSKSIATEVAPTSEGGRRAEAIGLRLCSWLPLPRFAGERAGERGRSSLPCAAVSRGRSGREAGAGMDAGSFSLGQDARSKSPAPAHELAGHKPGKRQAGWPSLWPLSLTPGILPSALRASFAVRTRSRRVRGHPRESGSRSVRSAKAFALYPPSRARASRTGCAPTEKQQQKHRAQGALLRGALARGVSGRRGSRWRRPPRARGSWRWARRPGGG